MCNDLPKALQTARQYAETLESWLEKCQELMQEKADQSTEPLEYSKASIAEQVLDEFRRTTTQMAAQLESYEDRYTR